MSPPISPIARDSSVVKSPRHSKDKKLQLALNQKDFTDSLKINSDANGTVTGGPGPITNAIRSSTGSNKSIKGNGTVTTSMLNSSHYHHGKFNNLAIQTGDSKNVTVTAAVNNDSSNNYESESNLSLNSPGNAANLSQFYLGQSGNKTAPHYLAMYKSNFNTRAVSTNSSVSNRSNRSQSPGANTSASLSINVSAPTATGGPKTVVEGEQQQLSSNYSSKHSNNSSSRSHSRSLRQKSSNQNYRETRLSTSNTNMNIDMNLIQPATPSSSSMANGSGISPKSNVTTSTTPVPTPKNNRGSSNIGVNTNRLSINRGSSSPDPKIQKISKSVIPDIIENMNKVNELMYEKSSTNHQESGKTDEKMENQHNQLSELQQSLSLNESRNLSNLNKTNLLPLVTLSQQNSSQSQQSDNQSNPTTNSDMMTNTTNYSGVMSTQTVVTPPATRDTVNSTDIFMSNRNMNNLNSQNQMSLNTNSTSNLNLNNVLNLNANHLNNYSVSELSPSHADLSIQNLLNQGQTNSLEKMLSAHSQHRANESGIYSGPQPRNTNISVKSNVTNSNQLQLQLESEYGDNLGTAAVSTVCNLSEKEKEKQANFLAMIEPILSSGKGQQGGLRSSVISSGMQSNMNQNQIPNSNGPISNGPVGPNSNLSNLSNIQKIEIHLPGVNNANGNSTIGNTNFSRPQSINIHSNRDSLRNQSQRLSFSQFSGHGGDSQQPLNIIEQLLASTTSVQGGGNTNGTSSDHNANNKLSSNNGFTSTHSSVMFTSPTGPQGNGTLSLESARNSNNSNVISMSIQTGPDSNIGNGPYKGVINFKPNTPRTQDQMSINLAQKVLNSNQSNQNGPNQSNITNKNDADFNNVRSGRTARANHRALYNKEEGVAGIIFDKFDYDTFNKNSRLKIKTLREMMLEHWGTDIVDYNPNSPLIPIQTWDNTQWINDFGEAIDECYWLSRRKEELQRRLERRARGEDEWVKDESTISGNNKSKFKQGEHNPYISGKLKGTGKAGGKQQKSRGNASGGNLKGGSKGRNNNNSNVNSSNIGGPGAVILPNLPNLPGPMLNINDFSTALVNSNLNGMIPGTPNDYFFDPNLSMPNLGGVPLNLDFVMPDYNMMGMQ